jgi:glycosyl transferase, family 25
MKLQNFFSKIYVINLAERTDRRHEMLEMLKRFGIDSSAVSFFPGIRPEEPGGFRTIGARGCFLSHLKILEEAEKEHLESVLILEDDLEIIESFPSLENRVFNILSQKNWDIIYLGHSLKLKKNDLEYTLDSFTDSIMFSHFIGFHGRIIPAIVGFLKNLISNPSGSVQGGPMDIDGAYSTFRLQHPKTTTLVSNPSLGYQRSSRGDISPYKWFDKPGPFRYISSKFRTVKKIMKRFLKL